MTFTSLWWMTSLHTAIAAEVGCKVIRFDTPTDSDTETFFVKCERYLHCMGCDNHDYCIKCLATKLPLVDHYSCSKDAGWVFFWSPASQYSNDEWTQDQTAKAKEYSQMRQEHAAAVEESERLQEESSKLQQENRELEAKTKALRQENLRMQQQQQAARASVIAQPVRHFQAPNTTAQRSPVTTGKVTPAPVHHTPAPVRQTRPQVSNAQKHQDKVRRENLLGKVAVSTISAFTKLAISDNNAAWGNADFSNNC